MLKATDTVIEWRSNKNGDLIAFENSNALCDMHQAREQAFAWARAIQFDRAIIVGLGSGFHISALRELNPGKEIIVIDCRTALIGFYQRQMRDIEFINEQSLDSLKKSKRIHELMEASSEKFIFKPALGCQNKFLEEIFWFLNLRTTEALSFYTEKETTVSDNFLINAKQFIESTNGTQIPYTTSEVLTIQELMK